MESWPNIDLNQGKHVFRLERCLVSSFFDGFMMISQFPLLKIGLKLKTDILTHLKTRCSQGDLEAGWLRGLLSRDERSGALLWQA